LATIRVSYSTKADAIELIVLGGSPIIHARDIEKKRRNNAANSIEYRWPVAASEHRYNEI
jgi:hypothetical protein